PGMASRDDERVSGTARRMLSGEQALSSNTPVPQGGQSFGGATPLPKSDAQKLRDGSVDNLADDFDPTLAPPPPPPPV
ncbi:MAG: hypothetical protein ABI579_01390, partial [Candidatus Sumerlaeota bacterium]